MVFFIKDLRVSINYWGMTRSTKHVYKSHQSKLFDVLKSNNILFDVYMHTWKTDNNFIWGDEISTPIDYDEYKFLNPSVYQIDNQDDFLNSINFSDYFDAELFNKCGENNNSEWFPFLIKNHLCALESQKRVTQMCIDSQKKYDFIIYVRPDVEILDDLPIYCLNKYIKEHIILCNNNYNEGYNDRFAIVPFENCEKYGKRIDEIKDFRKSNGRIVSEKYLKYIVDKYYKNISFIDFKFNITRPRET